MSLLNMLVKCLEGDLLVGFRRIRVVGRKRKSETLIKYIGKFI